MWILAFALLTRLGMVGNAAAATFTVDRVDDEPSATTCDAAVPNDCSLRGAVVAANALAEPSRITVPSGHYVLTQPSACFFHVGPDPNNNETFQAISLCLSKNITIAGAGAADTIIDADQVAGVSGVAAPVFVVSNGVIVELRGVTITKGNFNVGSLFGTGGGIRTSGVLTLTDTIVSDNFSGGPGGGIYNTGALTVVRSVITRNTTLQDGGGIFNQDGGTIALFDSVVSENSGGSGPGIFNFSGTAAVTNSTLRDNVGAAGGGAQNGSFNLFTLTNTTVSGNRARSGGGLGNGFKGTMILQNVTVTNNTAQWSDDPARGIGGGVTNIDSSSLIVENSLIAGNFAAESSPDCNTARATLTSRGYNLIENTEGCPIDGDTTGNIIGQPAELGVLADNGGSTPTHALLPGSPAIDAGSPAVPGSGGTACAATDQRGLLRPVGAACDMGAYERLATFDVVKIQPGRGGNTGAVLAHVSGNAFLPGATVALHRAGQQDIAGVPVAVERGGSAITTDFDLTGAATGSWDLVVTNPDGHAATLAGAFVVEETRAPELWVEVVGPRAVRPGSPAAFTIAYGNRGNVDALAVPLSLSLPDSLGYRLLFELGTPPTQDGQLSPDWPLQAIDVNLGAAGSGLATNLPFLLPVVPAGFSGSLQITLTLPPGTPHGATFTTLAALGAPLLTPTPSAATVSAIVEGARAYAQTAFELTLPDELVPGLEDYVRAQLAAVVANGRTLLIADNGSRPRVHSLAWLQIDVALYGAAQVLPAAGVRAPGSRLATWLDAVVRAPTSRLAAWLNAGAPLLGTILAPSAVQAQAGVAQPQQTCPVTPCKGAVLAEGCSCIDLQCDKTQKDTGTSLDPGCYPPPIPQPPGCQLSGKLTKEQFLSNLKNCRMTRDLCESLPNHRVVTNDDGSSFCVPNSSSKHCPKIALPNPLGAGSLDCIGTPINLAADPNDKSGTTGIGDGHFIVLGTPLSYTIQFENDPQKANAPAQVVVISDPLDPTKVDLDTFSLGPMSFGNVLIQMSPGVQRYSGGIDLRPAQNLLVLIDAGLNRQTGMVTWRFTSVDPDTQQLTTDPDAGFLPPDHNPPEGEGRVAFSVAPKPGLSSGTEICNQASIVFDVNEAIRTPSWCNGIDNTAPSSAVVALPPVSASPSFTVSWSGADAGAGIGSYSVFVSADDGPFVPFVIDTTDTSATFTGQAGVEYAFYSVASDLLGNVEATPPVADAHTFTPTQAASCVGDCNNDMSVTVDEILAMINVTLGSTNVSTCRVGDANHDGEITIDEILTAVKYALTTCPAS